jgi:8-oxo-dGTP pyrophosphatase MutT (NUDIX family)
MGSRAPVRYQGAIVRPAERGGAEVLLIRHVHIEDGRSYWLLPGGGLESGETPEQCVAREMLEETGLTVRVERLLFDVPSAGHWYDREHTYLCTPLAGEAAPGDEPEFVEQRPYDIAEVGWFSLASDGAWGDLVHRDAVTLANLRRLQAALGQASADRGPHGRRRR